MTKRSLSGNVGIGVFLVGFVCVCVAFGTSSWLVNDPRIVGAQLDQLGLWRHCFRSLPNPQELDAPKHFFVGCRWIYDPFIADYSEIRGFRLPPFMIATQVFFTVCFVLGIIAFLLILLFILYLKRKSYIKVINTIGYLLLVSGLSGVLAVIIFASFGKADGWMPGHTKNYLGWSFVIGVIGSVLVLIASGLMLVEANVQRKNREARTHFQLESSSSKDPNDFLSSKDNISEMRARLKERLEESRASRASRARKKPDNCLPPQFDFATLSLGHPKVNRDIRPEGYPEDIPLNH